MSEMKSKMPYVVLNIDEDEYKLKFSAISAVNTEKRMKCSIVEATGKIDSITIQLELFYGALQKYHKTDYNTSAVLYEKYLESGSVIEFAELLMEVYDVSGFMKKEQIEKAREMLK